MTYKLSNRQKT